MCVITDPGVKAYIRSFSQKEIPVAVSPQLVYNSRTEQPNYYIDWAFTHLAIVERGAYGGDARVIGACDGDRESCHKKLQSIATVLAASSSPSATATAAAAAASAPELRNIPSWYGSSLHRCTHDIFVNTLIVHFTI